MLYQMVEDYLTNIGMDGHHCLLRAICEAHELPFFTQGFIGEALRMLLTASFAEELPSSMDTYLEAEKLGSSYQDCSKYMYKCAHTIFSSRESPAQNTSQSKPQARVLYYTTDRRITFPPKTNGYFGGSFFINNFRGAYTGTSLSMSITTGVSLDFDALYLTSPEHPLAPIEDVVAAVRRKRNAPPDLPAVNAAGGDRELMYPAVEEHLQKFGLNGKACLLRAICEVNQKPIRRFNIIGELLMLFLKPSKSFRPERRLEEYLAAEKMGRQDKNCKIFHEDCPKSFFVDVPNYKMKIHPQGKEYLQKFSNYTSQPK